MTGIIDPVCEYTIHAPLKPYNAEHWIRIPMLLVYGHYKFLILSVRGLERRQILTSKDDGPRTERVTLAFVFNPLTAGSDYTRVFFNFFISQLITSF